MSVLEEAKKWALEKLIDDDTLAILLVGAWAKGVGKDINDIDVILIKQFQLIGISHEEHRINEFNLDIWVHDKDAIHEDLYGEAADLNQINNTSMILAFLQDSVVWFEKEPFINELKEKANNWSWSSTYTEYLNFKEDIPSTLFLSQAYDENVMLLEAARKRLLEGKQVSHRRKDYPELIQDKTEDKARKVLELTEKAYLLSGIDRHWTEFDDGRKAILTSEWGKAVASLKDVLRFIVRYQLPSVPEQLLDPSIWKTIEEMTLSEDIRNALEEAYT